ncbi:hypothetical protein [sulfur-oxidizing endosymbiont of Gigantopelta aegis]|uniref:hypothetical protein n=1 Tax=sulfur-oxidizing endosymbiont of Gigantopelta aegis TaxID=2794934 RepID=UPI0018DE269A|nr:hypothetical protein [sulfur-oxidizing endosymbiont of Gigantopelta aegis]
MINWSQYCQIANIADNDIKQFHIVDLNKEYAPNNYWALKSPTQGELRIFQLEELKVHIDEKLRDNQEKTGTHAINARLDKEMLLRFRQQLSFLGSQKEQRSESQEKVSLVIGMTACHYFIRGEIDFDPQKEIQAIQEKSERKGIKDKTEFSLSNLSLVSLGEENITHEKKSRIDKLRKINPFLSEDMLMEDSWDQINSSNVVNAKVSSGSYTHTLDDLYREEFWQEKNKSDGGMMLFRDTQSSNILQVGMLIAYRRNIESTIEDEKKYSLGIIRWLRIDLQKGVVIGIYNLSDECDAVAVKALEGVGKGSDYNPALLISSTNNSMKQSYLLVPSGVYDTNTILELWFEEKLIKIKITHKIMTTNTVTQVKFEIFKD